MVQTQSHNLVEVSTPTPLLVIKEAGTSDSAINTPVINELELTVALAVDPPAPRVGADGNGTEIEEVSIYNVRQRRQKHFILAAAAFISILTPFTDTVYLPALHSVEKSLKGADQDTVAASVSVYMAAVGVVSLLWGPCSDKWGRRNPILVSLVLYLAFTLGCIWSPDIGSLIGLRAVEGAVVGSTISVTQGVIADTFAPHERGTAMGWFLVPLLVGPIVAPLVGGALAAAFDWRATFALLAGLGILIALLASFLPETHQYFVLRKLLLQHDTVSKGEGSTARASSAEDEAGPQLVSVPGKPHPVHIIETDGILSRPPKLVAPWSPLAYLVERQLAPYVCVATANFSSMFVSLTVFPTILAAAPYNLSESVIGACYLPIGFAMMIGSQYGGAVSDAYAAKRGGENGLPTTRLVPSLMGSMLLPVGCIIYGLCVHYGASIGGVLVGHAVIGAGQALYGPGQMAYISSVKQNNAAGAASAVLALEFAMAGILISAAVPLQQALGMAGLFGLLAAFNVVSIFWAWVDLLARRKAGLQQKEGDVFTVVTSPSAVEVADTPSSTASDLE